MWPSIITIDDLLGPDDLATVRSRIGSGEFVDGAVSAGGGNLEVKNNREMAPAKQYVEVVKLVEQAIKANDDLRYSVFPRTITRAIVSKYDEGMSYGVHIDSPVIGFTAQTAAMGPFGQNFVRSDFSMTIFLSEPDDYDGGELSFESPWGDQTYKLAPGAAVVYPTGLPHQVMPVTRGARFAAVLWLQSMIRDAEHRRLVADLSKLAAQLNDLYPDSAEAHTARDLAANALRITAEV